MTNKRNNRRLVQRQHLAGWDLAIADAEKRIEELKYSIEVFRTRKELGQSWPLASVVRRGKK